MKKSLHRLVIASIALGEIVGGILGIVTLTQAAVQYPDLRRVLFLVAMYSGCLGTLLAGIGLLRGRRYGLQLSILCQALQIPQYNAAGVGYEFVLGPRVIVALVNGVRLSITAGVAANLRMQLSGGMTKPLFVGINLLAIAALILVIHLRSRQQREGIIVMPEVE